MFKRPTTIIVIIVLFIVVGLGIYEANNRNYKPKSTNVTAPKKAATKPTTANFAAVSTDNLAYSASISSPNDDGSTFTGTLISDGKGTMQYTAMLAGQSAEITYTPDSYYMCTGGQCFKYAISQSSNSGFNPANYTYTTAQLSDYRKTAKYNGKKSCLVGTCDSWSVTVADTSSTILIDVKTQHISEVKSTVDGKTSTITYDYKPLTIKIPADAQTITSSYN